jgi:ABC-type lipoprotein export system ATPase subunit
MPFFGTIDVRVSSKGMITMNPVQAALRTTDTGAANEQASERIIEMRGVVKSYHTGKMQVFALRGVDLIVERGEMVAVMGPSGCGKTTLLNCLSGLDTVDDGQILIEGTDLSVLSDKVRTRYRARNMGFVFQFYNLLPVLSAVENVELPLLVSGEGSKSARSRALEELERVGLGQWANHRPAELSGGQRQRVTIARALVNNPAIVWADEPTGDLDSETADSIMQLMVDLNRMHRQTFVIVTHDPRIGAMTHRIINMQDGRVVANSDAATSKARPLRATASAERR